MTARHWPRGVLRPPDDLPRVIHGSRFTVGAPQRAQVHHGGTRRAGKGMRSRVAGDAGMAHRQTGIVDVVAQTVDATEGAQTHHAPAARPAERELSGIGGVEGPADDLTGLVHALGAAEGAPQGAEIHHATGAGPRKGMCLTPGYIAVTHDPPGVVDRVAVLKVPPSVPRSNSRWWTSTQRRGRTHCLEAGPSRRSGLHC